jgi:hypothetical protein
MRLKAIALGGAAALALTLGANAGFAQTTTTNPTTNDQSAPAQAQSAPDNMTTATPTAKPAMHHYRHHVRHAQTADETPAERTQTVDLNKQELAKVGNTSNASVASTNTASSTSNMTAENAPAPADAATEATAHNGPATSNSMSSASMAKRESLDNVSNPKSTLASATVQNSNGQSIGQVKKISVGSNGKTQAVDVQIKGQSGATTKTIRLDANDLSYDKDNNVLVTPLSSDQLSNMPSSPM